MEILKKSKTQAQSEAHDRILKPLQCIFYVLLASVIMLIGGHSRFGLTKQIFLSIGTILFFNILITNGLTLVRKDSANWFLPYLCLILGVIAVSFLFFRTRRPFILKQLGKGTAGRNI